MWHYNLTPHRASYHSIHAYAGDGVVTTLHLPARSLLSFYKKASRVVGTYFITKHIRHLTDDRLENTSGANALMLRPDKLKLPDLVGHEPFLVSRPDESTRKMQSPKNTKAPNPHRYRGLYLHKVSKETREELRK
jgi:hypothetical protein